MTFKEFHKKFPYLDIEDLIIHYSIFSGYPYINDLKLNKTLQETIKTEIIDKIDILKNHFRYSETLSIQKDFEKILTRLAIGDRKNHTIYNKENLSQIKARGLYKELFDMKIIKKEKSREKPLRDGKKPLKKSLRRYKIQDKIYFQNNFTRFWFVFIAPNLSNLKQITSGNIISNIDRFTSLEFENLSNSLIAKKYKNEQIYSYGGYWDKNMEIDLLFISENIKIAGEAKWKNHKICKNILNSLQNKCKKANLKIDRFALFSKSGYSKELYSKKYDNISLYELKDFEELL